MKSLIFLTLLSTSIYASSNIEIKKVCYLKPCQIKGDFDGDGKKDVAFLVENKVGERGVQIRFASGNAVIIGAGTPIGNGGANFDWMDHWELHRGKIVPGPTEPKKQKSISTKFDSLYLAKTDSASGIVYWTGSEFDWIQQAD